MKKLHFNSIFSRYFWVLALIDLIVIQFSQSTFDSGDSVLHYLHAKQAIQYPRYFLEHWSKPLFVLLAAIPASFGFWGMKLFNSWCVLMATWFAFKYLKNETPWAWLVIPFCLFAPEFFLSQASGLTEPLFSAVLMVSIYLWKEQKVGWALILASFLPFVRSEGWFVLPLFGLAAILSGKWKQLLWLITGHLLYGLAGFMVDGDFLWMFHENPYQGIEPKYGNGEWNHYLLQTPFLLGIPLTFFFAIGLVKAFQELKTVVLFKSSADRLLLIYGITVAFFAAHSIFWHFGLFHSYGLKRVFIAIIPLMAIMGFNGVNLLLSWITHQKVKSAVVLVVISLVVIFPFTPNKTGFGLPETFQPESSQDLIRQTAMWYQSSPYKKFRISYGNHYFAMAFKKDMDNPKEVIPIGKVITSEIPPLTIIFWDNYFSATDQGVEASALEQGPYRLLRAFSDSQGNEIRAYLKE